MTAWRDSRATLHTLDLRNMTLWTLGRNWTQTLTVLTALGHDLQQCPNLSRLDFGGTFQFSGMFAAFVKGVCTGHGLLKLTHFAITMVGNVNEDASSVGPMQNFLSAVPCISHLALQSSVHNDVIPCLEHTQLESLQLAKNIFQGRGAQRLGQLLPKLYALTDLDISKTELTDACLAHLALGLHGCPRLRTANLAGCMVRHQATSDGVCAVMRALATRKHLTHLDLSMNELSVQAMAVFAGNVRKDSPLRHFNVMDTFWQDGIMQHVVKIVLACSALHTLDVRRNRVGRDDLATLLRMSNKPCSVRELRLSGIALGWQGVQWLREAQPCFARLMRLELVRCDVGDDGAKIFAECVSGWPALQHVDLSYNEIMSAGGVALAEAQKDAAWKLTAGNNFMSREVKQRLCKQGCVA